LLAQFHRLAERHPAQLRFAGNSDELAAAHAAGAIAGIPGIEGGHSIEESLDELHWFFERGVRVLTLVWNNHLSWVRSCQSGAGAGVPVGLSDFGRSVVRAMNELGMVVDVSHAGERSFFDALETSSRPVIASHSGCKALHDHPRNLTDEQLRELARAGGAVGIVFCTAFLSAQAQAEDRRLAEGQPYQDLRTPNDTETWLARSQYLQREAAPLPAEVVADHVVHAALVAGIDHVGIGSDYDGIQRTPRGLEDARCYGHLGDLLLQRGFSAADVAKVLRANMERVFAAATRP
jgi:membrane dipeptidase